jgi:hypothetical protein
MNGVPELLILRLLQQDEMYGYEIVQAIRERTGAVIEVGEGVVYPVLHGLEGDGALKARRRERGPTWPAPCRRCSTGGRMQGLFNEIRERLLRAGVAPRHVRRYLTELEEHLADLVVEEEKKGRTRAQAQAAAVSRLGGAGELSRAMAGDRRFRSLSARAPWAVFGLGAPLLLAGAYLAACLILWTGWGIFLPGAQSPFTPLVGAPAIIYFGVGRLLYFCAPVLVGWALGIVAIRQRLGAAWPLGGLAAVALIAGAAQVHAGHPISAGGAGRVSMSLAVGASAADAASFALRAAVVFALGAAPCLVWRLSRRRRLPV